MKAERGNPTMTVREDGTIVGFDPGFGNELAAEVVVRKSASGTVTVLSVRTWDPTAPPSSEEKP